MMRIWSGSIVWKPSPPASPASPSPVALRPRRARYQAQRLCDRAYRTRARERRRCRCLSVRPPANGRSRARLARSARHHAGELPLRKIRTQRALRRSAKPIGRRRGGMMTPCKSFRRQSRCRDRRSTGYRAGPSRCGSRGKGAASRWSIGPNWFDEVQDEAEAAGAQAIAIIADLETFAGATAALQARAVPIRPDRRADQQCRRHHLGETLCGV